MPRGKDKKPRQKRVQNFLKAYIGHPLSYGAGVAGGGVGLLAGHLATRKMKNTQAGHLITVGTGVTGALASQSAANKYIKYGRQKRAEQLQKSRTTKRN